MNSYAVSLIKDI